MQLYYINILNSINLFMNIYMYPLNIFINAYYKYHLEMQKK